MNHARAFCAAAPPLAAPAARYAASAPAASPRSSSSVPKLSPSIRKVFTGPLVLNQDYSREAAQRDLDEGVADAIAFGRLYIANPDLVERFRRDAPLNTPNPKTFYAPGPAGYTDYPALDELETAQA